MHRSHISELENLEIQLLLTGIYQHYGYDFRQYARSTLLRRIRACMREENLSTISGLLSKLLHDPACMERVAYSFCITATAMFRDPSFFLAFRREVVPLLRTYPSLQVWLAGCATGEEAYSMAILLEEEGLYAKSRIYATDMSDAALRRAESGAFSLASMQDSAANYHKAAGKGAFTRLFDVKGNQAVFKRSLRKNITFAQHNLVSDRSFNEFSVILCRNVLIYFDTSLQKQVHGLLYESLGRLGFLGLGDKETLSFTPHEACYRQLGNRDKLYRKIC